MPQISNMMHLPNEIVFAIFDHLRISLPGYEGTWNLPPFPEELAALARLCRTSKQLRELVEPILYGTIPYSNATNRQLLLRTLIERPHLRALVRSIQLYETEIPPSELLPLLEAARPSLDVSDDLAEQLLTDLRVGQSKWHSEDEYEPDEDDRDSLGYYRTRHVEIHFALLLLPRLDVLELASWWDLGPLMFEMLGRPTGSATGEPGKAPLLTCLRELRIRSELQEERKGLIPAGLLTLPNIQSLQAQKAYWDFHDIERRCPGGYLNVRKLDLVDSICNGPALADMLSRCPSLRDLRIEWGLSNDEWEDELDFRSIGDALRRHGQALEVLELDCREAYPYAYEYDEDELGHIGSLRELGRLKKLTLPLDMLIGRQDDDDDDDTEAWTFQLGETLPASLEQLHFLSCENDKQQLDDHLFNMIVPGDNQLSGLREVIMEERETGFGRQISDFGWVVRMTDDKIVLEKN